MNWAWSMLGPAIFCSNTLKIIFIGKRLEFMIIVTWIMYKKIFPTVSLFKVSPFFKLLEYNLFLSLNPS